METGDFMEKAIRIDWSKEEYRNNENFQYKIYECIDFSLAINYIAWQWYFNLMTPYSDTDLGHVGSGNGLLPYGTKPLPEPKLTFHQWGNVALT